MPKTPDHLTKQYYRDKGFNITKVEGWGVYPKLHRVDFLGIYDYIAWDDDLTYAIQTSTKAHMSDRRKKMLGKQAFKHWMRNKNHRSVLHGWFKNKSNRWEVKEEELTMKDWDKYQAEEKRKIDEAPPDPELHKMLYGE